MNPSTINIIVMICLILLSMTFVDSIIVTIGGKKLFKKAQKNEKSALYPVANLFTLLEISEMSTFYGILFFVPVINCVVLFIMFYKLGGEFDTSTSYKLGLALLPIIFFPLLANSDKQYKLADEEYLLKLDSAKDESINLLSDCFNSMLLQKPALLHQNLCPKWFFLLPSRWRPRAFLPGR